MNKEKLAEKCYKTIKELKLKTKLNSGFLLVSPSSAIPEHLFYDMAQCGEQLIKLFETTKNDKT